MKKSFAVAAITAKHIVNQKKNILVWSEGTEPKAIYPQGINGTLAYALTKQVKAQVSTATLTDPEQGLSPAKLDKTDILIWFGHEKHEQISDQQAALIAQHIKQGMGFIALHSSHFSKPFRKILGTSGAWRSYTETGEPEQMQVVLPEHPIVSGIEDFIIPQTEVFAEPFEVPEPDAVIMEGYWQQSNTKSREVMTWQVEKGRVVYIRAGHEDYPIYHMPEMQKLIANAVQWLS